MKKIRVTILMFLIVIHAVSFQQSAAVAETWLTISRSLAACDAAQAKADLEDQQNYTRMMTSERRIQLQIADWTANKEATREHRLLELALFDEMDSAAPLNRQSRPVDMLNVVAADSDLSVLAEAEGGVADAPETVEAGKPDVVAAKAEMRTGSITIARVTAYAPFDNQSGMCNDGNPNSTSTGQRPGPNIVAVDPRKIPYGTKLKIQGFDRIFTAGDTGSILRRYKGIAIDVYFDTYRETRRFGVQYLEIEILD